MTAPQSLALGDVVHVSEAGVAPPLCTAAAGGIIAPSACHPFYTGKQKILDTGGRVARFEARYGKRKK